MISHKIEEIIKSTIKDLYDFDIAKIELGPTVRFEHGDYATNIAFLLAKKLKKSPLDISQELANALIKIKPAELEKIEAKGGFINFFLSQKYLFKKAQKIIKEKDHDQELNLYHGQKIMVEYAHPNTHKEMHVGHLRTLLIGESLSRIFEYLGAKVFRANYQGDIGLQVAKAIYGLQKILKKQSLTLEQIAKWNSVKKAHLLGQGYVLGNQAFETLEKEKIELINSQIYTNDPKLSQIYQKTRQWSLEYFADIYKRLGTHFDRLFFESQVAKKGKQLVEENIPAIFEKSEGAVVFPGEKYGLHRRVFVTSAGNPTYEAKDLSLVLEENQAFAFDRCIHVVANEQTDYFKVIFKAIIMVFPQFKDKEFHLAMGMVNLIGRKISSRTGELVTVDELLEEIKKEVQELIKGRSLAFDSGEAVEVIAQAAVKYAYLKVDPIKNLAFDVKQSISLDGESGPYLQYTFARIYSLLQKAKDGGLNWSEELNFLETDKVNLENETLLVLRQLERFNNIVYEGAKSLNPSIIASYLFDLSQGFNNFYNQIPILRGLANLSDELNGENLQTKLLAVEATGKVLEQGLNLLGINVLNKM